MLPDVEIAASLFFGGASIPLRPGKPERDCFRLILGDQDAS
jgi:hypothetical protein